MYYLIGRDLDGDGRYEFIQDLANMILTADPYRALQVSEYDLTSIDMAYLNEYGFYALEADRFQVSLLERLLFRPVAPGYRPRITPPPRRPRPHRPEPPKPRRHSVVTAARPPRQPAPAHGERKPRPAAGPAGGPSFGRGLGTGGPSRPGSKRGSGGPGGRGFGR